MAELLPVENCISFWEASLDVDTVSAISESAKTTVEDTIGYLEEISTGDNGLGHGYLFFIIAYWENVLASAARCAMGTSGITLVEATIKHLTKLRGVV